MATGYSRVYDTVVSGSALLSALNGEQVRDLEFASAMNNFPPLPCLSGAVVPVEAIVESSIRNQLIYTTSGSTGWLDLGPDAQSQALAYVKLFNFQTTQTGTVRLLQFALSSTLGSTLINVRNTNLSSTYVAVAGGGVLFNSGNVVGDTNVILVQATNLASGSERVLFTVGSALL